MPRIELRPDLRTLHHRDQHERRTRVASQTSASPPGVLRPWSCEATPSPEQPPIPHHRLRRTHPHPGKIRVRRVHDRIELQPRHHRRHHQHQAPPRRQPVVAELARRAAIFCIPAVGQARRLMPLDQRILVGHLGDHDLLRAGNASDAGMGEDLDHRAGGTLLRTPNPRCR